MGKPKIWVSSRSDANQPRQSQEMVRGLKFCIFKVEEELYCPCSENKGADQLRGYREADLRLFVFAYVDCWYSQAAAHLCSIVAVHTRKLTLLYVTAL